MSDDSLDRFPVLGICGYSGSGKTTLIEAAIPALLRQGLHVAAIKHDAHGLQVDRPGKDSDRFFRAGATVSARGPGELFLRWPADRAPDLAALVRLLAEDHDVVLVEGHKQTPLPARVWLERRARDAPPPDCGPMTMCLARGGDRLRAVLDFVRTWLPVQQRRMPVFAGVLIGGGSRRMGRPKQLMRSQGRSWLHRICDSLAPSVDSTVLLGEGPVPRALEGFPRLPDAPGRSGPVAGMVSAMRWAPRASWVFIPCDVPMAMPEAVRWLLDQREPGRRAVFPQDPDTGRLHPLFAWYDARIRERLEATDRPIALATMPGVFQPAIPRGLVPAWANVNTPSEWRRLRRRSREA